LIIFGGREGDGSKKILNDVFILDTVEEKWIQPEIIGEQPNPRMGHTAQLYNSSIIIHGGWDGFKVLDDLVFIELQPNMEKVKIWTLEPKNDVMPARQFHTASIIDDKMYIFGGGDGKYWLNDLLVFHLKTYEWVGPVETKGRAPSGRLQHAAIVYDKKIFIFGGEPDRYRQLNDLFYLDIRCQGGSSKMTWYQPSTEGVPPTPRVSATGCLVDSEIFFFGGFDGMRWLNDLHTFCLKTMTWSKKLTYGNKPSPRCRHSTNYLNGKLYIFGGNDCDKSFNTVHTIQLLPPSTLRKDLKCMLNDELFADITFVLEESIKIRAHRSILSSRCDVFKSMFLSSMQEGSKDEIEIKDTNAEVFKAIINYIYTDDVEFDDLSMVANILVESNKYNLIRLKKICEWELTKIIDHDNVIDLLHLSDIHDASELRNV
jgi:N-acetylneuraminic acid mutarotase